MTIRIDLSDNDYLTLWRWSDAHKNDCPEIGTLFRILDDKMERMVRRSWYDEYKTAPTPEQRETARQHYLDHVGVPEEFRWPASKHPEGM